MFKEDMTVTYRYHANCMVATDVLQDIYDLCDMARRCMNNKLDDNALWFIHAARDLFYDNLYHFLNGCKFQAAFQEIIRTVQWFYS